MAINNQLDSATPSATQLCTSIQDAAVLIKKNLLQDRESTDLSQQLNVCSVYSAVCSGMKEDDYPTAEGVVLPQITDVRRVPLPPELVEQFGHMQCNCIIGVFPEIGRAWLTVDSDIFVWRYADGDDLTYFDGLAETILSVALVQPKPGIFRDHIKYLLVLTTPLDVVILGVSFAGDDINNEMHLLPDPLFTISSDSTYLLHTVGTSCGRIFTGGKDGCLYEIVYQAKGGWFSRSCVKINHSRSRLSFLLPSVVNVWLNEEDSLSQLSVDDTRNILYTRSEKGTISVYDLGEDGLTTSCVAQLRLDSIQRKARDIASGIEPSNLSEIVYIAPITLQESRHLHLVAVTQAGVRLYFMTCQSNAPSVGGGLVTDASKLRPSGIYLVHVRLPPGFTGSSLQRPTVVHAAHYNAGTLLLSSTNGDDGVLWCINHDMYAFDRILKETHTNFSLDGRAWVISEVSAPFTQQLTSVLPPGTTGGIPPDPPIHVIQHIQKPSEYVVITSQGCHIFNKLRPVDQLRYLLENTADPESQAIEAYFKLYNNGEAACSCIILAMSTVPTDQHIAQRAVAALIHYGGIPQHKFFQPIGAGVPQQVAPATGSIPIGLMSPIAQANQQPTQQSSFMRTPGGLPVISTPMPSSNPPPPVAPVQYNATSLNPVLPAGDSASDLNSEIVYLSERQHGAYKMLARITRPLWEGKLVQDCIITESGKSKTFVVSRLDIEVISAVLEEINLLKAFVGKHCLTQVQLRDVHLPTLDRSAGRQFRHTYTSQGAATGQQEIHRRQMVELAKAELASMKYLYDLLKRSTEILGLWRILLHHQIHVLHDALDPQSQTTLKTVTFHDLVLTGEALCTALVSALINQFMDDNTTIDALNAQLREVCPTFYSAEDALCSKASELLHVASSDHVTLKQERLKQASQIFQQIAGSINLPAVLQQYQSIRYYSGAVELCIRAAHERDEQGLAFKLYNSALSANDPQVDPDFRKAYLARAECYKYITDMIEELMMIGESHPQTPSVPTKPGPPPPSQDSTGTLKPEEAQELAEHCLQLAIQSNDELLHVTIYEWLLRKEMTTQLLRVNSQFIEQFLRRVAASHDENPSPLSASGCDLLWKYYERSGQHASAAEVLSVLAEKPGPDRNLAKRIEYLSRAKMNAKSITSPTANSNVGGSLLYELEEKLEVAQIQLETLECLKEMNEHESVNRLNSQLLDVTTLYTEFAEPYQLAECKLAITHCSGLHDYSLVKALWKNIIEDELQKCASASETSKAERLRNKIIRLGKRYASSRRYFPVEYLVVFLEKMVCSRNWEITWVFTCLLNAGVSMFDVIDIYIKTHAHKLPCWKTFDRPYHLLWVESEILKVFVEDPVKHMPTPSNRRRFVNRLLDALAAHLVQLRSITMPDEGVRELISKLRRNQADLENLQERR